MIEIKNMQGKNKGFTLIELMVALGIIAVLAAFALPAYRAYVETSEQGQLISNIQTMEVFQEDFFLRNGAYANNLANIAAIDGAIGWTPQRADGITYSIANSDGTFYRVTAISPNGMTVCVEFPDNVPC